MSNATNSLFFSESGKMSRSLLPSLLPSSHSNAIGERLKGHDDERIERSPRVSLFSLLSERQTFNGGADGVSQRAYLLDVGLRKLMPRVFGRSDAIADSRRRRLSRHFLRLPQRLSRLGLQEAPSLL